MDIQINKNKRYIVEVEGFENEFYGLKFYWKGVEKSKDRYSLLTNDYEPRTIMRSCIEVMLEYYRKNRLVSFGFVAAPDLDKDIKGKKVDNGSGSRRYLIRNCRIMLRRVSRGTFPMPMLLSRPYSNLLFVSTYFFEIPSISASICRLPLRDSSMLILQTL